MVSPAPLSVIEVARRAGGDGDVVVGRRVSPVVTVSVPLSPEALRSPIRPVTTKRRRCRSASAVCRWPASLAFTVTVSPEPLAVIEVVLEPVVIVMALSAASPVVTVSAPVSARHRGRRPGQSTTKSAEPDSVSSVFCASAAAFTVTVSFEKLSVIEVAAEPVVMVMALSAALPVVTVSVPVSARGVEVADQAGHHEGRRAGQRQHSVVCARVAASTVMMSPRAARRDRGRRRAGGDGDAVVRRVAGGDGQRAGER